MASSCLLLLLTERNPVGTLNSTVQVPSLTDILLTRTVTPTGSFHPVLPSDSAVEALL